MPKVSVIIPAYNRGDILPRTIESVLAQTFKDFELIIVDDGSSDNTGQVAKEYAEKDKRIKYIYQSNSGGAAGPKNTAFKVSSGEYIAYLDHDDEWLPEKLEKQIKKFAESDDKLGLVSCDVIICNNGKELVHKMKKYNGAKDLLLNAGDFAFSNSGVVIPRQVIEAVGERDEHLKLFEDQDMFIRIAQAGYSMDSVNEPLFRYFIDDNNFSKDFKKASEDYERFLTKHYGEISKHKDICGAHYRHLATMHLLGGNRQAARKAFIKSIKADPNLRNIATAGISLLGRKAYLKILNAKKEMALSKQENDGAK